MSRPARFAAIDNGAIDSLPSILSIGLLTRLIRARDGDPVTVESLTQEYAEGEAALSRAMRALVDAGLVVKFKIQRSRTELVVDEESGEGVERRGGSWFTEFSVDSVPHTGDDVAVMLEDITAGGNVRAVRVEPQHLDPRKSGGSSEKPQVGPTPAFPGAGRPGVGGPGAGRPGPGQAGALIRKKTVLKDSLSGDVSEEPAAATGAGSVTTEREKPAGGDDAPTPPAAPAADSPPESATSALCVAWASGAGIPRTPATIARQIATQASGLTAAYPNPEQQRVIAEFAGRHRWTDLERAAMHPDCARLIQTATRPASTHQPAEQRATAIADCNACDQYGWLLTDDDTAARKCRHLSTPPVQQAA